MKNYSCQLSALSKIVSWLFVSGEKTKTFYRCSLFLVVFSMPFSNRINSASLILLFLAWCLEGNWNRKLNRFLSQPILVVLFGFYLLFIFGMINTANIEVGIFNLEKKLWLLILPIVIGTSATFDHNSRNMSFYFFVIANISAALLCLLKATYNLIFYSNSAFFLHDNLASAIGFQPPYFGLYIAFCIIILINYIGHNYQRINKIRVMSVVFLILSLFVFLLLLSARMVTVFLILYIFVIVGYLALWKKRWLPGLCLIVSILFISFFVVGKSEYLLDRIVRPITSDINAIDGGKETGLSIRLVKWNCSLNGIIESPLFGKGTGDAVDYLVDCYKKNSFWGMYPQYRFNSHNQFLETTLTLGLCGLLCLLLCIILPGIKAYWNSDYLFLSFLFLFAFCCLTESVLERQWGLVFFTFFTSLLGRGETSNRP
jgi:O-antigen ligase